MSNFLETITIPFPKDGVIEVEETCGVCGKKEAVCYGQGLALQIVEMSRNHLCGACRRAKYLADAEAKGMYIYDPGCPICGMCGEGIVYDSAAERDEAAAKEEQVICLCCMSLGGGKMGVAQA